MQRVEVVRTVLGPRAEVFARYADHESFWSSFGVRLERLGEPSPNGVGCVRVVGPGPFAAHEEITAFEPNQSLAYRVVKGPMPIKNHSGEVHFEDDGEGTRIVWRCQFDSRIPGLGGPLRWLIAKVFRDALSKFSQRDFRAPRATVAN
jgi:hypothetical protein